MNGITARQANCIQVLCGKLGRPAPVGLESFGRNEASESIEKLSKEVDARGPFQSASEAQANNGNGVGAARRMPLTRDAQTRLGLAAKLVHQRWTHYGKKPGNGTSDDFKKDVAELYAILGEVEHHIAAQTIPAQSRAAT